MAGEHVLNISDHNFDEEVLNSDLPVLVDFWAPWCGPCMALGPVIENVAAEQAGKIKVCKVNVDDSPSIAARFGVRSIPTLVLINNGEIIDQVVGGVPKGIINELLKKV
ncbi:MAG: thioredoxin [Deltaproteobacteria bacterium CG07_land_8_20_14_0_80_38_7]|nr:MAG: thioredoxin [Deltaproteobacteria bacterium CG07_land_8_20_14_0_80_38_7]